MKRVIGGSMFLALGALAGFASALAAIELYGSEVVEPGLSWSHRDVSTASAAHPYALGHYLLAGRLPPAAGQMREFSAKAAADGESLDGSCDYVLSAKAAPPRWWSLTVVSDGGLLSSSAAVMTAEQAIAESDGSIRIAVSRLPQSGNWIKPPASGHFTLLHTIADTSPNLPEDTSLLFTITRSGC